MRVRQLCFAFSEAPKIPKLPVNNARRGIFERYELEKLIPHLHEPLDDMSRFAYTTGWRVYWAPGASMDVAYSA